MTDRDLLIAYVRDCSDEAFSELVRRHVDMVHSAAIRQTGNYEQARDVTQSVFLILARKASTLRPEIFVAGWLYRTARFVALEAIRSERRRKLREQTMMQPIETEPEDPEEIWKQVSPALEEVMEKLRDADRDAIMLRFFKGLNFREVGAQLGIPEDAAK